MPEIVRVLRVLEYTGTREFVNSCLKNSIQGSKIVPGGGEIKSAVLGIVPDILDIQLPIGVTQDMIDRMEEDLLRAKETMARIIIQRPTRYPLIHKDCGGEVRADTTDPNPYIYETESGTIEKHFPLICQECHDEITSERELESNE